MWWSRMCKERRDRERDAFQGDAVWNRATILLYSAGCLGVRNEDRDVSS
jgi:hypothetical protein